MLLLVVLLQQPLLQLQPQQRWRATVVGVAMACAKLCAQSLRRRHTL